MGPPVPGLGDHGLEPLDLAPQAVTWWSTRARASTTIVAALRGVVRGAEPVAVPGAGLLVLEQLADLREREAGVVAQPADEPEPLEVLGVVQAIVALGAGGGCEEAELLVVADRPRREPGLGGDLLDPEESGSGGIGGGSAARSAEGSGPEALVTR